MARTKEPVKKKDQRKVPQLFRAVMHGDHPVTYYCELISDNGFNVVCFGAHDGEESVVKERTLEKHDFDFSKIEVQDFSLHARIALHRMKRQTEDHRFNLEAAEANQEYAENLIKRIEGK